ncbi:MAG TPA: head GIN domain-containing protein [Prolixibacteraceae bacterium]|nr:head GIN domain-containing protein [Prolixibacteraceae bacterium]
MKKIAQIFLFIFAGTSLFSCLDFPLCISGTGPIVTQTFDLEPFDKVEDGTVVDVEIVQGDSQKVVVEGNENMMNYIELQVINNKLHIDLIHGSFSHFKLKVYITVPTLREVEAESTGDIHLDEFIGLESLNLYSTSTGNIHADGVFEIENKLRVKSSSTGNISIAANCYQVEVESTSTGNISIKGNCHLQEVELHGTGNYNAFDLNSEECTILTNGTGDARVTVSEELDAKIHSIGSIYYKGNPRVNIQDTSIGKLIWAD